jgi:polyvinyl alcohol dehydrogenase (cytochrome)
VWVWRPRDFDPSDLDFGAVPNLFEVGIGGASRQVVGVGAKDGTYYLLDRDGVNPITARVEPYWRTNVVAGGSDGGIIGSAAVGGGQIFFGTAIGEGISSFQLPAAWALRASDGAVTWSNRKAAPSFGPTTAVPDVTFRGVISNNLLAHATDTGDLLATFSLGGPVSSGAAVIDGEVFVGAGTGAREGSPGDQAYQASLIPSYITALCLGDASDCPTQLCDDGNPCTYDAYDAAGTCHSEAFPDGLPCKVNGQTGICQTGTCQVPHATT